MYQELLRPFGYLTVSHPSKWVMVVNWLIPVGLALVLSVPWWPPFCMKIDTFGSSGLFSKLLGFIQSLPGFYLAALAAISTFNSKHMDLLMPGVPPEAYILHNGRSVKVQLTRRRMLSIMFAYLTALSFGLTLSNICATTFAGVVAGIFSGSVLLWLRCTCVFVYLLLLCQMLVITLWGLFYLGERIHTPN